LHQKEQEKRGQVKINKPLTFEEDFERRKEDYAYYWKNKVFSDRILDNMHQYIQNPELIKQNQGNDLYYALNNLDKVCLAIMKHNEPSRMPILNWHISYMCDFIQDIIEFREDKLLINIPPGHTKTTILILAVCMYMGFHPGTRFIIACQTKLVRIKFARYIRETIKSPFYKSMFPYIEINNEFTDTTDLFFIKRFNYGKETEGEGSVCVSSDSGSIIGADADFLIWDDPVDYKKFLVGKFNYLETVNNTYNSFTTRDRSLKGVVNSKTPMIICQQRISIGDVSDIVQNSPNYGHWKHVKIPVKMLSGTDQKLNKKTNEIDFGTVYKTRKNEYFFKNDTFLFPMKFDDEELQTKKYEFSGKLIDFEMQYFQDTITTSDKIFNMNCIQEYSEEEFNKQIFDFCILSVDGAFGESIGNDYHCAQIWFVKSIKKDGHTDCEYYLRDIVFSQVNIPEFCQILSELTDKYLPSYTIIEEMASGNEMIRQMEIKRFGRNLDKGDPLKYTRVVGVRPFVDKVERVWSIIDDFNMLRVHFPQVDSWCGKKHAILGGLDINLLQELYHEMNIFPNKNAAKDDGIDSMSMGIGWCRRFFNAPKEKSFHIRSFNVRK
jgi:phage terminase large subunit-like protein